MIKNLIRSNAEIVEKALEGYMDINGYGIEKAMSYSLLSGGKRIRPFLTLEVAKMLGMSDKTFYTRMKSKIFGSDEIEKMIVTGNMPKIDFAFSFLYHKILKIGTRKKFFSVIVAKW